MPQGGVIRQRTLLKEDADLNGAVNKNMMGRVKGRAADPETIKNSRTSMTSTITIRTTSCHFDGRRKGADHVRELHACRVRIKG